MITSERFRAAMRCYPGGVTIVASGSPHGPVGLTASSVTSLSDDPPSLLVCVNRTSGTYAAISASRRFSVNVLGEEHVDLALRFAGATGVSGPARFDVGCWSDDDLPVLTDAAVAMTCEVVKEVAFATHAILVGRIADVHHIRGVPPLAYVAGDFARLQDHRETTAGDEAPLETVGARS